MLWPVICSGKQQRPLPESLISFSRFAKFLLLEEIRQASWAWLFFSLFAWVFMMFMHVKSCLCISGCSTNRFAWIDRMLILPSRLPGRWTGFSRSTCVLTTWNKLTWALEMHIKDMLMASLNYLNYRHVLHELQLMLDLFDPTTWKFWRPCVTRPFVKYVNYNHIMPTRYQVGWYLPTGPGWPTWNLKTGNKNISHPNFCKRKNMWIFPTTFRRDMF